MARVRRMRVSGGSLLPAPFQVDGCAHAATDATIQTFSLRDMVRPHAVAPSVLINGKKGVWRSGSKTMNWDDINSWRPCIGTRL